MSRRSKGFTLVESLAAAALLAVGFTSSMAALAAVSKAQAKAQDQEYVQNLAIDKYDELVATPQQALSSTTGDFTDRNIQGYTWNLDVEPSNTNNLSVITVTVTKQNGSTTDATGTVEGLLYVSPNTTSTSTAAGATP